MGFKTVMHWSDGDEESDEVFQTREEAEEFAENELSNYDAGAEVLHLSNPYDYPADDSSDDIDYDIIEV